MKVKEEVEAGSVGALRTRKWLCWQRRKVKTTIGVGEEATSLLHEERCKKLETNLGCTQAALSEVYGESTLQKNKK